MITGRGGRARRGVAAYDGVFPGGEVRAVGAQRMAEFRGLPGEPDEPDDSQRSGLDCSLSAISTWHGEPAISTARFHEYDAKGNPIRSGEHEGVYRAEEWLGASLEEAGYGSDGLQVVAAKLREGDDGSAALIVNCWGDGSSHAWKVITPEQAREVAERDREVHESPNLGPEGWPRLAAGGGGLRWRGPDADPFRAGGRPDWAGPTGPLDIGLTMMTSVTPPPYTPPNVEPTTERRPRNTSPAAPTQR